MFRWYQQIYMTEDSTSWFIQNEISESLIARDPLRLLPKRVTRRRFYAADDYIANLPFGVTTDYFDGSCSTRIRYRH